MNIRTVGLSALSAARFGLGGLRSGILGGNDSHILRLPYLYVRRQVLTLTRTGSESPLIDPPIEATARACVAGRPGRVRANHQCILIAIDQHLFDCEEIARSLPPSSHSDWRERDQKCTRPLVKVCVKRGAVHMGDHQHITRGHIDNHRGQQPGSIEFRRKTNALARALLHSAKSRTWKAPERNAKTGGGMPPDLIMGENRALDARNVATVHNSRLQKNVRSSGLAFRTGGRGGTRPHELRKRFSTEYRHRLMSRFQGVIGPQTGSGVPVRPVER